MRATEVGSHHTPSNRIGKEPDNKGFAGCWFVQPPTKRANLFLVLGLRTVILGQTATSKPTTVRALASLQGSNLSWDLTLLVLLPSTSVLLVLVESFLPSFRLLLFVFCYQQDARGKEKQTGACPGDAGHEQHQSVATSLSLSLFHEHAYTHRYTHRPSLRTNGED